MKKGPGFNPEEIIFSATDSCNLHCEHCFVSRNPAKLSIEEALSFLESCKDTSIYKIGFSGGEPFLYLDFVCAITEYGYKNDFVFDRIMTNGIWWQTETELTEKLQKVYDAGFDGKIGLSYDSFHGQSFEKILTFINEVFRIWNNRRIIEIQSVISYDTSDKIMDLENIEKLSEALDCQVFLNLDKKTGRGTITLENQDTLLTVYRETISYQSQDKRAWQDKKWFKDDFCMGPGQILFVHSNGNIAPCCGFANENPELFIGSIKNSFQEVMKKASENPMIKICYEEGLSKQIKPLKKKLPGKTTDICAFCDFVCKNRV